jgi:hypothetical protein
VEPTLCGFDPSNLIVPLAKGLNDPPLIVTSPPVVTPKFEAGTLPLTLWLMVAGATVSL